MKFVININETVNNDESAFFFHGDDFSSPFFKRKLGKGTYTLDFEPINNERYSVTFTASSALTDRPINAARSPNDDAGRFSANAEAAAAPKTSFQEPSAGNAALWEKLGEKNRAVAELAKTDEELFAEIQALNKCAKSISEELEKKRAELRRLELAVGGLKNAISEQEAENKKLTEEINDRDRKLIELKDMYERLEAEYKKDYPSFAERKAELENKFAVDREIVNYYLEKGEKPLPVETLIAKILEGIEALEEQIRVLHREREANESAVKAAGP
jgi:DNA repair exonuclease SbcCD ATPase subunit